MKNLNLITLFSLLSVLHVKAQQFTLSGQITGEPKAYIFLKYVNNKGETVKDSCSLKNGQFSFKGNINGPTHAYFAGFVGGFKVRDDSDPNSSAIFLEPGNIVATGVYGHLKEINVTGSKANDESIAITKLPLAQQIAISNSIPSAFIFNIFKSRLPLDSVEHLYKKLSPAVKESNYGKEIEEFIIKMNDASPGKLAKIFTAKDLNGKPINLADFKGHMVLLDFWASWCVPCRESTPHLIKLYKKYKTAGLEVIAVADDDNEIKSWKKAIQQDRSYVWHNVLAGNKEDAQKSETNINYKYSIHSIPTKILIDKNGIIIGRYTGTDETGALDKKLADVFGNRD